MQYSWQAGLVRNLQSMKQIAKCTAKLHSSIYIGRFIKIVRQNKEFKTISTIITINGRGIYAAPCVMILMRANPLRIRGPL